MEEHRCQFIVAIIQNKAKEVGMAALDLRSAAFHLSQFIELSRSYQNTLTLLEFFDPSEVITSTNNVVPTGMVGLSAMLDRSVPHAKQVTVPRSCFDDTKGAIAVQSLAANQATLLSLNIYEKDYYLCLAAAAAVVKWVQSEKGIVISKQSLQGLDKMGHKHLYTDNIQPIMQPCGPRQNKTVIATVSVQNLEVMEPLFPVASLPGTKRYSLFGMLNTTCTVGGRARLRASLLQPLKDIETINARLDCLDELTTNEKLFFGLAQSFQKFPKDLANTRSAVRLQDRVLCQFCVRKTKMPEEVANASVKKTQALVASIILLKEAMDLLPNLAEILRLGKCSLLQNITSTVLQPSLKVLRDRIGEVIDEEVLHSKSPFVARTQQCFAIRSGVDGFLDVARRIFCDTSEGKNTETVAKLLAGLLVQKERNEVLVSAASQAIHALGKRYREGFNLPKMKMPFNNKRGFYISIPSKDLQRSKLPSVFIQVKSQGKTVNCTTIELDSLNIRNREAASECYMRTEHCLEELAETIRQENRCLTLLSESLSILDMMVNAFAQTILDKPNNLYTRPEFTENGPIAIENGRHPILDTMHPDDFVANNTFLSEASNMMIVTGPNMSGKSTYLRQVALITILAHIGCYVPAKYASFRIVDRLFTRLGTKDDLDNNLSTFQTEMRETAYILQNATSRSLIVIDELGRATSTCDGLAIAWSCCEYLLSLSSYTIFATHFHRLEQLSRLYPCVKVCYFSVAVSERHLNFKPVFTVEEHVQYELKEGHTDIPHYGLLVAQATGLPEAVLEQARQITSCLELEEVVPEEDTPTLTTTRKEYQVAQRLLCLQHANVSGDKLRAYIVALKETLLQE